jgi:hypothetical protein
MSPVRVGGRLAESLRRTLGPYKPWPRCVRQPASRRVMHASRTTEREITLKEARMKGRRIAAAVLLSAVACLSSALGDTLSVALGDIAVITGAFRNKNVGRIVLRIDVPEQVLNARVDFAKFEFPAFLCDTGPTHVTVVAHTCQTAWKRDDVSWTKPWKHAGGDFDSLSRALFTVLPGDKQPVVLNITPAVREWQKGRGKHGLFLKRPDAEGGGFFAERDRLRGALSSARVKFYFTPVQE